MKLTILGSGTSHGVPVIGCHCKVCGSTDPRDKRLRASLYIQGRAGEGLVIDTGPEFRLQAIRAGIEKLDAVFLTHGHADHLHGLDDIRTLSREKPLPVYGNDQTIEELRERFSYVFRETQRGGGKPRLEPQAVRGPVHVGGLTVSPLPVKHGALDILGWRIEEPTGRPCPGGQASVVYLTDTSAIPGATAALAGQPDILVIGALRIRPHETHFTFEQALDAARGLGARRVYLTHICHDLSHGEIEDYCRAYLLEHRLTGISMEPAYDGLELEPG
jgi:phosphoribosyl 1,2-cyclic phosphate phosphodiesterase